MVCGDFNIALEDRDVYDPEEVRRDHHTSPEERQALADLKSWGLVDVFRQLYDEDRLYTWWDYRAGDFHNHRGMRIDLVLASKILAGSATWGIVDRDARKGKLPSDHAPVVIDSDYGG